MNFIIRARNGKHLTLVNRLYLDAVYLSPVYYNQLVNIAPLVAIQSFSDKDSELFFFVGTLRKQARWRGIHKIVRRKLDMLHYAGRLDDMKSPPGNRLEALRGDLSGSYSIMVNDQWRIVFKWRDSGAFDVRVIDYHS